MTNLAENLAVTAAKHPDQPALRLADTTCTFAELEELGGRAAAQVTTDDLPTGATPKSFARAIDEPLEVQS